MPPRWAPRWSLLSRDIESLRRTEDPAISSLSGMPPTAATPPGSKSRTSSADAAATTHPVIRDFWPKNNANSISSSNAADAAGHCPGSTKLIWPMQDFSIRSRHWTGQSAQAPNQVIWTLREVDRSEVGINESIKLAVVVAHHGPFRATVKVSATTGVGLKVRSFPWSRDDPLLFDGRTPKGKQLRVSEFWGLEEKDLVQHMRESSSASSSDSTLAAAFDDRLVMGLPPARPQAKSTSAFRVRGIPSSLTLDNFVQSLVEALEVEAETIRIHCFTTNPYRAEKMAIVSFATLPSRLKEPQPTREWQTPPRLPTSESNTANLLFDTHFLGFSELGPGFEGSIDVDRWIRRDAYGSFKQRGGDYVWLEESLPRDLQSVGGCRARVLIYGYDSAVGKSDCFQSISDLAKRMRASLQAVRELLILLSKGDDDDVANLKATIGALFFGVPNRGMDNSALLAILGSQPNQELLRSLSVNSPFLKRQSQDFPSIFSFRDSTDGKLTMDGEPVVLVDTESATHSRPWEMCQLVWPAVGTRGMPSSPVGSAFSRSTALEIYRSTFFEQEQALPPALEELHARLGRGRGALGFDDAAHLMTLLCASTTKERVRILLGALDECSPAPRRRKIMSLLDRLGAAGAKVVVTSPRNRNDVADIEAYTEHMIDQSDELFELLCDRLRCETVRRVVEQANKMFLLAVLQCLHLSRLTRRSEVKKALRSLPSGLDMAYEESMLRITQEATERRSLAIAALSWIYHAERPLTVSELLQAFAIDSASPRLSDEDSVPGNLVLDVCGGLVIFDHQRDAACFAHYSVHEYFDQESTHRRWFLSARQDIARATLAFLMLEKSVDGYHDPDWLDGIACAFLGDKSRVELVTRILDADGEPGIQLRRPAPMYPSADLGVLLAARVGALEALELLARRGHSLGCQDPSGRTALHWAARGGFHHALRPLLQAVHVDASTSDGRTALHWAAKHGRVDAVMELMRSGADPTLSAVDGRTALHWAASRGHKSIVEVLLSDTRVDAGCWSVNSWTALQWAACSGNPKMAVWGVDPQEEMQRSTLSTQRQLCMGSEEVKGHEDTVKLLLEAGVSPNLPTKRGITAVHWAAASGHASMLQLLKGRGAVMSAVDVDGKRPWHFAVESGAKAAMTLLSPAV
ncbi:hypothetical protein B0T18DRAFT_387548 [Schizothecium vesticola]|uniref:GPI inositol-deacylase winged helix domain-containing protein n=1 Tax=Schizothecium vesticola TaxID=314040 RepID=A0AA40F5M6_9PEZI|nr:hypothetical protein B0T18DRAFT_387548 [Schizothecium vesticola]